MQANDTNQIDKNDFEVELTENVNIFERLPSQVALTPLPSKIPLVFMKICLEETDDMLLFENNSYSVLRDTDEAKAIENDNKRYHELVMVKDKQRKMNDIETQTVDAHYKTRGVNTDHIEKSSSGTFVSNYDMYDTYANLETKTEHIQNDYDDRHEQLNITTYSTKAGNVDFSRTLGINKSFQLTSIILQRVLAGNVFHENQRRFRNLEPTKSLEPIVHYLYRLKLLYKYRYHETTGSSVSCMSWCPKNTDILAIGYGIFKCQQMPCKERERSAVCLWNIKVC